MNYYQIGACQFDVVVLVIVTRVIYEMDSRMYYQQYLKEGVLF